MVRVAVAQIPRTKSKTTNRELYATVCYYYNYKLAEASQLSARDIQLLIKTARKLEAKKMYDLTQIAAAPQTKKGQGVKQLSDHFKKVAK